MEWGRKRCVGEDKCHFLPAGWPAKAGRSAGIDRISYQAISFPSVPDSAAALPGKTDGGSERHPSPLNRHPDESQDPWREVQSWQDGIYPVP